MQAFLAPMKDENGGVDRGAHGCISPVVDGELSKILSSVF